MHPSFNPLVWAPPCSPAQKVDHDIIRSVINRNLASGIFSRAKPHEAGDRSGAYAAFLTRAVERDQRCQARLSAPQRNLRFDSRVAQYWDLSPNVV